MATNTTLYLTKAESAMFSALPDALREGWTVEEEKGTAYEDADVLKVRASMARFDAFPQLREFVRTVLKGESVDPRSIKDIPQDALPELFFTIGAVGVTHMLCELLPACTNDEDIEGVVGLSHIRRDILNTNASISIA